MEVSDFGPLMELLNLDAMLIGKLAGIVFALLMGLKLEFGGWLVGWRVRAVSAFLALLFVTMKFTPSLTDFISVARWLIAALVVWILASAGKGLVNKIVTGNTRPPGTPSPPVSASIEDKRANAQGGGI